MPRARFLRSTSFRLSVIFATLFIAAFIVSSVVAVQTVHRNLVQKLERDIAETHSVIAATFGDNDVEDLIGSVATRVALSSPGDEVFLLTDATGTRLAGNVPFREISSGWSTISATDLGLAGEEPYRVFAGAIGDYRLAVGKTYAETDDVAEIVTTTFVWATMIVLIGAVLGGIVLAVRLQRRMDAIAGTMARVSEGELKARVPLLGNGDDIDVLSGQINATLDRLSGLFEGMKQVSADIAHDLKTPLNRLKMIIQSARGKQEAGLTVDAELAEADAESDRINTTFDALLRIAQIEAGARKARFAPVALRDVVLAIAEAYVEVVAEDGKTLVVNAGHDDASISGDRQLLLQMCSNLVENAMAHCPVGTTIRLSLVTSPNGHALNVADDGPGIPESEKVNVLRRLYRLEKSRTTPGSGLGLSLVKAIADLHGAGLVLTDNAPGLRITVQFPLPQDPA